MSVVATTIGMVAVAHVVVEEAVKAGAFFYNVMERAFFGDTGSNFMPPSTRSFGTGHEI